MESTKQQKRALLAGLRIGVLLEECNRAANAMSFQKQLEAFEGMNALPECDLDDPVQLIGLVDFFDSGRDGGRIADRSKVRPRPRNVSVGETQIAGLPGGFSHRLLIGLALLFGQIVERSIEDERQSYSMTRLHEPRFEQERVILVFLGNRHQQVQCGFCTTLARRLVDEIESIIHRYIMLSGAAATSSRMMP